MREEDIEREEGRREGDGEVRTEEKEEVGGGRRRKELRRVGSEGRWEEERREKGKREGGRKPKIAVQLRLVISYPLTLPLSCTTEANHTLPSYSALVLYN